VVLAVLGVMLALGYWKGKDEASTSDFFLGGRSVPVWAACLSFVATEISAMTIISVPATAYRENWQYLQFFIGSAAARVVIAFLFIPAFYKFECTTIYEFLLHRFGPATRTAASIFFFITRLLAAGVRLYVASKAVSILMGWSLAATIAFFTVIGMAYIAYGGIKAIVWTNVVQSVTFMVAGAAAVAYLAWLVPGGLSEAWSVAAAGGRTKLLNLGPEWGAADYWTRFFGDANIVWLAALNGLFGSMAAFGTDHELMQRLLTLKTREQSQRTLIYTIGASLACTVIYLSVGTGLYVYYQLHSGQPLPAKLDDIFSHFMATAMPPGLRGLMLAAVLLASIDSPLGSLSACFVTDIYRPLVAPGASDRHYLVVARVAVIGFGAVLGALAWMSQHADQMLWLAFQIVSITYGPLLGVFLLGLTTRRPADLANVAAMLPTSLLILGLLVASKQGWITLGWTWLLPMGTVITYGLAWTLAALETRLAPRPGPSAAAASAGTPGL
jgi:SSS family transporter